MRFPNLIFSKPVIQDELISLDVSKSLATSDEGAITSVDVTPEAGGPTINVWPMSKRALTYSYTATGNKTVTVAITTGVGTTSKTYQVPVVSLASLSLFSDDSELSRIESDIIGYLPLDRSSFNYAHYRAQQTILANLDERRVWKTDGSKFQASDIADVSEVRDWSTYLALYFIFSSLSNQVGDIFETKAANYFKMAEERMSRAAIKLTDSNSTTTTQELTYGILRRV